MTKKIAYINPEGTVALVHIVDGELSLQDHIAISVPVELTKDGIVVQGVSEPFQAKAGDRLDPRLAAMNKLSYQQVPYALIDEADVPGDRLFRGAWRLEDGKLVEDTDAAKEVAHDIRRSVREAEFVPLDKEVVIATANPEKLAEAEEARQEVRDKYAAIQAEIDACDCPDTLREKLAEHDLLPA